MATKNKAAPGANRAASNTADHRANDSAIAQKTGSPPPPHFPVGALEDIVGLLSVISDDDIIPAQCSLCGADTRTVAGLQNPDGVCVAARMCQECADRPELSVELGAHVIIPGGDGERSALFRYLVSKFARQAQREGILPVVIRVPKERGAQQPCAILLYEEGETLLSVITPFPWFGDDPQIMGGRAARDALALYRAIVAGEASFTILGSCLLVESAAPGLLREWGAA